MMNADERGGVRGDKPRNEVLAEFSENGFFEAFPFILHSLQK